VTSRAGQTRLSSRLRRTTNYVRGLLPLPWDRCRGVLRELSKPEPRGAWKLIGRHPGPHHSPSNESSHPPTRRMRECSRSPGRSSHPRCLCAGPRRVRHIAGVWRVWLASALPGLRERRQRLARCFSSDLAEVPAPAPQAEGTVKGRQHFVAAFILQLTARALYESSPARRPASLPRFNQPRNQTDHSRRGSVP